MESQSKRAQNKKSLLAVGVLMLSLAALQSPLWRSPSAGVVVVVHSGGATLVASDRPIARVSLDQAAQATAEIVGNHEVLVRGKALGETRLTIAFADGQSSSYRVVVQSDSAKSLWGSPASR